MKNIEDYIKEWFPHLSEGDIEYITNFFEKIEILPISDPSIRVRFKAFDFRDWLYWKTKDVIFFDVTNHKSHNFIMYVLFCLEQMLLEYAEHKSNSYIRDFFNIVDFSKYSDAFIDECKGFFMSSISDRVTISEDYKMSAAEKQIFSKFKKVYI